MSGETIQPLCEAFGECGGCQYQDIPYAKELAIKEEKIKNLLGGIEATFEPIVASPKEYHYRHRLDLTLLRTTSGEGYLGFNQLGKWKVMDVRSCPIAEKPVSDFIPELKRQALAKLPDTKRISCLVVRTGDDGRVHWGGIGRHSLRQEEKDYSWTSVDGMKIFYSLETFFQANLSILPALKTKVLEWTHTDPSKTIFLDLYGGVGLFSMFFAKQVKEAVLVENNPASISVAKTTIAHNQLSNIKLIGLDSEEFLRRFAIAEGQHVVAMIDPPRKGLSDVAYERLSAMKNLSRLLYLSCGPESLERDLRKFIKDGWKVMRICPFDFFPKTSHIETLVMLEPNCG